MPGDSNATTNTSMFTTELRELGPLIDVAGMFHENLGAHL